MKKRFHDFFRKAFSEYAKNRCKQLLVRSWLYGAELMGEFNVLLQTVRYQKRIRNKFPFFLDLTITTNISATTFSTIYIVSFRFRKKELFLKLKLEIVK